MNDKAVYRTAPATPGPLKFLFEPPPPSWSVDNNIPRLYQNWVLYNMFCYITLTSKRPKAWNGWRPLSRMATCVWDTRWPGCLGYKIPWISRIQDAIAIWETRCQRLWDGMHDALDIWDTSRYQESAGRFRFRWVVEGGSPSPFIADLHILKSPIGPKKKSGEAL